MNERSGDNGGGFLDALTRGFAPVHRDGQKFVALGAVLALALFLFWSPLGWIAALLTIWIAYVFRDPDRVVPLREGLILAPADGTVEAIEELKADPALDLGNETRVRVSIHLSLFDVHIQRAPIAGEVVRTLYAPALSGRSGRTRRARTTNAAPRSFVRTAVRAPSDPRWPWCRSPAASDAASSRSCAKESGSGLASGSA